MSTREAPSTAARREGPARPLSRGAIARSLAPAAALAVLAVPAWWLLRETQVFSVDRVQVQGVSGARALAVERAAQAVVGSDSLLKVDPNRVAAAITALPTVDSASVDRAFPHDLNVTVVPEVPVAILHGIGGDYVIAASGRVVRLLGTAQAPAALPRIGGDPASLAIGDVVAGPGLDDELALATALRLRSTIGVKTITVTPAGLVAQTSAGPELRVGDGADLARKLAVARAVLRRTPKSDWGSLRYVDVSVPAFPAEMSSAPDALTASAAAAAASATGAPVPAFGADQGAAGSALGALDDAIGSVASFLSGTVTTGPATGAGTANPAAAATTPLPSSGGGSATVLPSVGQGTAPTSTAGTTTVSPG